MNNAPMPPSPSPRIDRPLARRSRRRLLLAAAGLALAPLTWGQAAPAPAAAHAAPPTRDAVVKASFLHKFASFVEWPEGTFARPDAPIHIGILGDEAVWRELSELARDRDRDGRPVVPARLQPGDSLAGQHILYLKAETPARIEELLATVPEGVLTVSDSEGAHPRGSVLSFFLEEGIVHFGVSVEAANRQKLRLDARLVSTARLISSRDAGVPRG